MNFPVKKTIAAAAIPIGAILLWHSGLWRVKSQREVSKYQIDAMEGDILCHPQQKEWTGHKPAALVVVTSGICSACVASKEFDQEVSEYFRNQGLPTYYVLPQNDRSNESARDLAALGKNVIRANLNSFGVTGVPTLLRVDRGGRIVTKWTGTASPSNRERIFNAFVRGSSLESYETIPESDLAAYSRTSGMDVIALSGVKSGAGVPEKLIPVSELATRARYELSTDRIAVIDCATSLTRSCDEAAIILVKEGFKVIAAGMLPHKRVCGQ